MVSPRRVQGLARGPPIHSVWELGFTEVPPLIYFCPEAYARQCALFHTAFSVSRFSAFTTTSGLEVSQYGGSEARRYPP